MGKKYERARREKGGSRYILKLPAGEAVGSAWGYRKGQSAPVERSVRRRRMDKRGEKA